MEITIVSEDRGLYRMCRELAASIGDDRAILRVAEPERVAPGADLYIWDFQSDGHPPALADAHGLSVFLVERKDVRHFRKLPPAAKANILLKPVDRSVLAAFLGLAFSMHEAEGHDAKGDAIGDANTERLIQANLRLQEHHQERTNLLASVAHDFRTPVNALQGYCGLLLDGGMGTLNEEQKNVLRRMQRSVNRLSRMASAVLEVSVELRTPQWMDLQPGDIGDCLQQALHEIAPLALQKGIGVTVNLGRCDGELQFDAGKTEEVLVNLLENACRFTPKRGSVEICGAPYFWERRDANAAVRNPVDRRIYRILRPNSYRIDIRNSGLNIPESQLDSIFEQYASLDKSAGHRGCGLGLAVCRTIIDKHGGRIWAENTPGGPQFCFVLPVVHSDVDHNRAAYVEPAMEPEMSVRP